MPVLKEEINLQVPAKHENAMIVGMTLSAIGMLHGLDLAQLGDIRTASAECFDCLCHQAGRPEIIQATASVQSGRLLFSYTALERHASGKADTLSTEITKAVLETLMPNVALQSDDMGVYTIECSMNVQEKGHD